MTDHAGLKELAEKATPGDWKSIETRVYFGDGGIDLRDAPKPQARAAYIAAVSPDRVLALLAEIERLRKALAEKDAALVTVAAGKAVIVPVEPTPEMRHAFHTAHEKCLKGGLDDDGNEMWSPDFEWAAMIGARG